MRQLRKNLNHRRTDLQISALYTYPVKSVAAVPANSLTLDPMGVEGDRAFIAIGANGRELTARDCPHLMLVRARWDGKALTFAADGHAEVSITPTGGIPEKVGIFKDTTTGIAVSATADAWLSDYLGQPCKLFQIAPNARRQSQKNPVPPANFADGAPVLVLSQASVDALNERLESPVSVANFRPNIVVDGAGPHAEDDWQQIRIGDVVLHKIDLCARCVMTTIDPITGEKHPDMEPMKTLGQYRRRKDGQICFGTYMAPINAGVINLNDGVEVL